MKKILLILLAVITVSGIVFAGVITRDGELVTPEGVGTITLDAGTFEAFPLPDYAAKHITDGYKSYFVEVEPGIKVHVLEVGSGFPVFLQHGNPTSGFLYRKVAEELPTDRLRVIMPTLVGLGFSSKIPASQHTLDKQRSGAIEADRTGICGPGLGWSYWYGGTRAFTRLDQRNRGAEHGI